MIADSEARTGTPPPDLVPALARHKSWADREARAAAQSGRAVLLDYWEGEVAAATARLERVLADRARESLPMVGAFVPVDGETARAARPARPAPGRGYGRSAPASAAFGTRDQALGAAPTGPRRGGGGLGGPFGAGRLP